MKGIISFVISFILLASSPCYALDLDSNNLVNNIIKSLDEERDRWIIRGGRAYYIDGHIDSDLRNASWPEQNDRCLVYLNYQIFHTDIEEGYATIDKPIDKHLHGNEKLKLVKKLRQVMYEELHNRFNVRMPKKKIVLKKKPEPVKQVEENGERKL